QDATIRLWDAWSLALADRGQIVAGLSRGVALFEVRSISGVLVKDGREVWGASGSSIARNLITFGSALNKLELPQGIGHGDPKDGVTAPRLLPSLYMVPTFWKA